MAKRTKKRTKNKSNRKPASGFWKQKELWLPILGILIFTAVIFLPSLNYGFVNWDDDLNILENANLNAFDFEHIKGIFTSTVIGNYNPLPIFTFAVEKAIFGLDPTVFHLNNILLHLVCVFFIYRIVLAMGMSKMSAILVALLFGIHPMRTESVVWVTERKDVLYGAFYLAAMFTYIQYLKTEKQKHYFLTLILFVFALFSKIQAVALPLSMVVLDYYFNKPQRWKLTPFFVLSAITGLAGIFFLGEDGSLEDATKYSFFERLLVGDFSYFNYLVKWIFPFEMSPLYPYPKELTWGFYVAPLSTLAVGYLIYRAFKNQNRHVFFGLAFFTFNVMFVLQILGAGQGFLADRFTYIPYFGLFFIMAWAYEEILKRKPKSKNVIHGVLGLYLVALTFMTFQQSKIWENSQTLWTHVIKHYDHITTPWANLGHHYRDNGDFQNALTNYSKAIDLKAKPETLNSRGKLYFDNGNTQKALEDYNRAIQMGGEPKSIGEIHINRGAAIGTLGDYDKALSDFNIGLELLPTNPNGYSNRSMIYYVRGQYDLAMKDYESYIAINPNNATIWFERGVVLSIQKKYSEAVLSYSRAIELNPNRRDFYQKRAESYRALGNQAAAQEDENTARELN